MSVHDQDMLYDWWASLKHGGLLIAPSKVVEFFPATLPPLSDQVEERLRRDVTRLVDGGNEAVASLLDTVLEEVLGLGQPFRPDTGTWLKGSAVPATWTQQAVTGEAIKPRRVWQGNHGAILPAFVEDTPRLGVGRGRRAAARVVEWLRRAHHKVALLTNAHQWRLVHAGLDHEAYAEADTALWFMEGQAGLQVTALRALLSPTALTPAQAGEIPSLLGAIEASRKGQAELSAVLGERVRQAVELLIREHGSALEPLLPQEAPRHIYLAATRMVMRMVIVLFAEARDLLPRDNPVYYGSYSLGSLRETLDRMGSGAGAERLRHHYGAWPRILALFRLVYAGSPHEALPVLRYGGSLFAPGDPAAADPVQRAMAVFEHTEHAPSDAVVHRLLELLTKSPVKIRQGRGATWVEAPVDFSDLSSEYIGILYEGLLDYELHRVDDNDPVIFLALGDEPALPLSQLETMSDTAVAALVEKSQQRTRPAVTEGAEAEADEEESAEADDEEEVEEGEEEAAVDLVAESAEVYDDRRQHARTLALAWACRAVEAGRLVKRPRSQRPEARREYENQVTQAAERLVARIVLPGEWYLVRFGGTRKGFGTFYTRPQLAVPTVQRTIRPLAYDPPTGANGQLDEDASTAQWAPKRPEEILRLKVCDPAMGSGSFLVAALRFLTDALFASLHIHGRILAQGDGALVTLVEGAPAQGRLVEEALKSRPDDETFEGLLRARLKRYVVERCLYGVDVDPLAVELGRLARL